MYGVTIVGLMDNGKTIKCMGEESSHGVTEDAMREKM